MRETGRVVALIIHSLARHTDAVAVRRTSVVR
jgi:hypothetical protein